MFEMKIEKIAHLTYIVIFHLKVIVCQNVSLPQTYCNHMESRCLVDIVNFIKTKNHFN